MVSDDLEENMQKNSEAPMPGLQLQGRPYALQCSGSPMKTFMEPNVINALSNENILNPGYPFSSELLESAAEYNKPTHFSSWSAINYDFSKAPLCQFSGFEGQVYPVVVDNQVPFPPNPSSMFPRSFPCEFQNQEFHYFVVIDFEATCDKDKNPHPQEIIEFPSVIVSSMTGRLEACFQTYVRPTCNQVLSDFCKDLTGIQQLQVDRGVTLSEALLRHDKWLEKKGIKNSNFAVVTWSNWDCRVMLESECRFKKIRKPPYFNRWINLKVPFQEVFGPIRCNLKEAVEMAGLTWQGRAHCGLDDARNTARLLALLMHKGFKFSITNSLSYPMVDEPFGWKPPAVLPFSPLHPPPNLHPHAYPYMFKAPPFFHPYCFCGVKSSKAVVQKPGPKQGSCFYGCGNWTSARGARCQFFEWASL